jgi:heptaprenylglyceryl phosphate synthase
MKSIEKRKTVSWQVRARSNSIRDAKTAKKTLNAGADIIVTGNMLRKPGGRQRMREIAKAVKG